MLNGVSQPVYVLDDRWTIVFCNRACQQWLAGAADRLIGRRCSYDTPPDPSGDDAIAAGLCPPPEVMAGRPAAGIVSREPSDAASTNAPPARRLARFIPLASNRDDPFGLIAIVEPEDLPAGERPVDLPTEADALTIAGRESLQLHEDVRRFRREVSGRCRADRLVGRTPAMQRARAQIEVAVASHHSVLITGPPGSGREHVATAIHYGSDPEFPAFKSSFAVSSGTLVPLSCSVLGAELIRSSIISLTSAGRATGGQGPRTLLLNDADQTPDAVQGELAAALGKETFPMRLIAAAERPLADLAHEGSFHAGLAAVLSTITIELPPLCERREDVPLLAQLFLEEANAREKKQLGGFSPEALDRLEAYAWPGNVDELILTVSQSHQRAAGPYVELSDLPERIHLAADAAACPAKPDETIALDEFLARVERELFQRALTQAKGNKTKAARLLGITRPRLYRRLEQLGLDTDS